MNKNWDSSKHWHTGNGSHSEFKGTGYNGKRRPDFYNNSNADKSNFMIGVMKEQKSFIK